jgi:hypothetical protein
MTRFFEKHKISQKLNVSDEAITRLASWLDSTVTDAVAARQPLEHAWRRQLTMYEGVPKLPTRDVPIENAPNIEVTLGAIASDIIWAQATDTFYNTSPFATVRPKPKDKGVPEIVDAAAELQKFVNHIATNDDVGFAPAFDNATLDTVQLGTGMLYVPWVENIKKTKTAKVLSRGPKIRSIAPEDIIVPSGCRNDIEEMQLFGFQFYYTEYQLKQLAKLNNINIEHFQPLGGRNSVREKRETLGKHVEGPQMKGEVYDVQLLFIYYDIDDDGLEEDLMVVYNGTGAAVGLCTYNPMDRRPASHMVYQLRSHMFYGLGVLGMLDPYEEKISDIHNYATLNVLLANSRIWAGDGTCPDEMKIYPGKVLTGLASKDSLTAIQMADVYSSIYQEQMAVMQFANQRVGLNDVVSGADIPNRTPANTTMSMLRQVNRRFAPAFKSMRQCAADALKQCLFRYQERLKSQDSMAQASIFQVLGYNGGSKVIDLLANERFDEFVDVELTAASPTVNSEADRQNNIMLTQLLGQYYQRTLELTSLAANPQTPPQLRDVALKVAEAAGRAIERTMRTFDQVRDPETFVIDVEDEIKRLGEDIPKGSEAVMTLMNALNQQNQQGQALPENMPERTMA